jgi:hypothetical protein
MALGILVNPEKHTVEIYRPNEDLVVLGDGDVLTVPDLLPGWDVAVADLWSLSCVSNHTNSSSSPVTSAWSFPRLSS